MAPSWRLHWKVRIDHQLKDSKFTDFFGTDIRLALILPTGIVAFSSRCGASSGQSFLIVKTARVALMIMVRTFYRHKGVVTNKIQRKEDFHELFSMTCSCRRSPSRQLGPSTKSRQPPA
ncbi:hypothetical protein RRG08_007829 [Elysia crispata]|uniref:Uncharacterized protein n=1 Tax=Elysia crispata TaxID=231223 RepID=A0AAE1CNH8_9GAST|nr:hypothetical protein RRG08_007829 [Elysia crispata]